MGYWICIFMELFSSTMWPIRIMPRGSIKTCHMDQSNDNMWSHLKGNLSPQKKSHVSAREAATCRHQKLPCVTTRRDHVSPSEDTTCRHLKRTHVVLRSKHVSPPESATCLHLKAIRVSSWSRHVSSPEAESSSCHVSSQRGLVHVALTSMTKLVTNGSGHKRTSLLWPKTYWSRSESLLWPKWPIGHGKTNVTPHRWPIQLVTKLVTENY